MAGSMLCSDGAEGCHRLAIMVQNKARIVITQGADMNPQLTASPSHYDDNEVVNPSVNPHMSELLAARLSRRQALRGGMGVTTGVLLGSLGLSACGGGSDSPAPTAPTAKARALALGFTAVAKNLNDIVTVPAGYNVSIVHALGDPQHFGDASWAGDGSESADSYNRRIGDGHDGMHNFGLSEAGKFDATRSDRGLLCVNHEYVVAPHGLHPNGITANNTLGFAGVPLGTVRVASEVDKEIAAHGVSITEIKRGTSGTAK
jgi:secreted PhoX family phosphatase